MRDPRLLHFERQFGIVAREAVGFIPKELRHDIELAMDAQPQLVTNSNTGIPAYLSMYMDPKVIEVLSAPNKAALLFGEVKKGNWTTRTTMFTMIEPTGDVASYGDWNNNGSTNVNLQFPQRQSYHAQTITQWGERQLDEAGLAAIDWAGRVNEASAKVLDKFMNNSYFYGIQGLENYGILNEPNLPPAITPLVKAAGGTTWAKGTANENYVDIVSLFAQLVAQTQGLVDTDSRLMLITSPGAQVGLTATNTFNVNVRTLVKTNFPTMTYETAPQYATAAGNLVQLIALDVDGQETGYCAFTEKMRTHPVIQDLSAFKQKKSCGTWGFILFQSYAFAQMIGV